MIKQNSIHYNERNLPISMIVLHCTIENSQDMIKVLEERKLSVHYIIGYEGELIQLVEDDKRAWHAGVSYWRGIEDVNSASIGIEISNKTLGQSSYEEKQIETLIKLLKKLTKKYNINPRNVVAHSDIAPTRKPDPGFAFPWKRIAREGFCPWYELKHSSKITENKVENLLEIIGYDVRDEETAIASAYAFRRRFLPKEVIIENDIKKLVDNVYPVSDRKLLMGDKFYQTLKSVAYSYSK